MYINNIPYCSMLLFFGKNNYFICIDEFVKIFQLTF